VLQPIPSRAEILRLRHEVKDYVRSFP
jgi:hypothetical protein